MILYLIRGLPGAGKSTLAKKLVGDDCVLEADQYFYAGEAYRFDPAKLPEAHAWCQRGTENLVKQGIWSCAVANTFTQRWEMEPYYKLKDNYDVTIMEITVAGKWTDEELARRSIHGVPVEAITRMRLRWEV